MITTAETVVRASNSDSSFFSNSKSSRMASTKPTTKCVVTTRVVTVQKPVQKQSPSPAPSNHNKRKAADAVDSQATIKKPRKCSPPSPVAARLMDTAQRSRSRTPVSTPSSRHSSRVKRSASPESTGRNSRSRSVTAFQNDISFARECWITEDGTPGPGVQSCEVVVKDLMKVYKAYFSNPSDPADKSFDPHPTNYPLVDLEYPNNGASERFILLVPKDKDHYNPIFCLQQTLHTMIQHYLTPSQQSLFGTIPNRNLLDTDDSPISSRASSPPRSDQTSLSLPSLSAITSHPPSVNYLKTLQRAIHKRDGPLFVKTMMAINALLRWMKYPPLPDDPFAPTPVNVINDSVKSWTPTGMPKQVTTRIIEETYQRCVGPQVRALQRYEAFSSEVYGELMPSLISDIIRVTGLNKDSLLLDLGSGVGNVVLQASLQTGCTSYGIEIMPAPAKIARTQLEQLKIRCRMWGVSMGDVQLEEGDMLVSDTVTRLMSKADVVLINNKVFLESLNESLRPKFLDLKEGAIVVSLKPFVPVNARLTERNIDDISAIFEVTHKVYHSGSVSWGSGSGSYYLHRVDREGYVKIRQKLERAAGTGRSTRLRR